MAQTRHIFEQTISTSTYKQRWSKNLIVNCGNYKTCTHLSKSRTSTTLTTHYHFLFHIRRPLKLSFNVLQIYNLLELTLAKPWPLLWALWRDLRKLLARAPASDLKPGKLQSIKICLDTIVDTSFWIFLTSASRKVDDTLIGKFLFKIPNSFFSWFQICRKIYRSAYSPTSSKRARSHVRGVPVCGLGEPVTSKACTHCAEFHFFWYPLTGKTMKTPQMLLPRTGETPSWALWICIWRKSIEPLPGKTQQINPKTQNCKTWMKVCWCTKWNQSFAWISRKKPRFVDYPWIWNKKNGMLWAPLPACDGFLPAICINQPSCQGLQRQCGKAWHFPWRYWINPIKGLQLFITSSMQHLPKLCGCTAWRSVKHTQ